MNRARLAPLAAPLLLALAAGCDTEPELFLPNLEPNTRISAGPPEATDTGYTVNLFWFGWDDDGFIDHYEIAWETPDEWLGPIFGNDSLFLVQAAESCCVEPLVDFGPQADLLDSVYEQFHTFYVRAVDNAGVPDPTPAVRSFNAKTIAPFTEIGFGPRDAGLWGTSVEFEWTGMDEDGIVVAYRRALATKEQFQWDRPGEIFSTLKFIAWLDTLQYIPDGPGSYLDSLIWEFTEIDSVVYPELPERDSQGADHLYLFAVRSIDDAGAEERTLDQGTNARRFLVDPSLSGPRIFLRSNIAGSWRTGDATRQRDVFAGDGIRFTWRASPGQSGTPVAGFSYAVEDTAEWSPFSLNSVEWPEQVDGDPEVLWFPGQGPHSFFVRAIDLGGFVTVLSARLQIFDGPRECVPEDRILLVVLDTEARTLVENLIWPGLYEEVEKSLIQYWFAGYSFQLFETKGLEPIDVGLLNCASSTVWLLSAAVNEGDGVIFDGYHSNPPNPLPSYVSAGGNIFLLGINPVEAMRFFERADAAPVLQGFPVIFQRTLTDTTLVPHWASTHFGIARINQAIANTFNDPTNRLRVARAAVPEYPDLPFDPLTWPDGPRQRGFGYYDREVIPLPGAAEVIYRVNDTNISIGVQRLQDPDTGGSTVYLGLHPYFVERPAFRQLVQAVLTNFGEIMGP